MRVIGGTYRSRPLLAPPGSATRPSSDRLRETLFNVLAPRIEGAAVLDLFCGTGAVGIEAISRGAAHVILVESAPAALRTVRANLQTLGISRGATVLGRPVSAALRDLLGATPPVAPCSIVFLDPPYESAREYRDTLAFLGSEQAARLLAGNAAVVAEHATRVPLAERYGRLRRERTLRQGDATLSFFAVAAAEPEVCPLPPSAV